MGLKGTAPLLHDPELFLMQQVEEEETGWVTQMREEREARHVPRWSPFLSGASF